MGAVLAAVSPAVIVPQMIMIMEKGYGMKKRIPQLILAGASVDDVYVIVLFSSFLALAKGGRVSPLEIASIPFSIVIGIATGYIVGYGLYHFFKWLNIDGITQLLLLLGLSFIIVSIGEDYQKFFAPLICTMVIPMAFDKKDQKITTNLIHRYLDLWKMAEIFLFVLVGAAVNIKYLLASGPIILLVIFILLLFRMIGVACSILGTPFNKKERAFAMLSYLPKATVQAAIGSVPLQMGLDCGELVLAIAVGAILITAPLGAFLIDRSYPRLLTQSEPSWKRPLSVK